ncbi:hypothetical protein PGT21_017974 [Puccinia graminis f. sp. tritici]|uniref:Uncharacterized protein n=1 Tax=Puccinia graminis f. sp. tritici TaxID=56615 RepID=A0A5B0MWT5_PUCGR|nr:hypothetical protein PGT21_017974 [Puccinia graminis f. sp. tritici]
MSHEFKVKRVLPSTDSASDSNPFFLNLKTKIPLITYPIDKSLNPLSIIHLNCTFDPNHLLSQINFTQEELGRKTGGEYLQGSNYKKLFLLLLAFIESFYKVI